MATPLPRIKTPALPRRLFQSVLGLVLCGFIAHAGAAESQGWARFQAFSQALQAASEDIDYGAFHSRRVLAEIDELDADDKAYALANRAFPSYFKAIRGHVEAAQAGGVCLVVSGVTHHDEHASLSLALVFEQGQLKFDQALLRFVDSAEGYLTEPVCPDVLLVELHAF